LNSLVNVNNYLTLIKFKGAFIVQSFNYYDTSFSFNNLFKIFYDILSLFINIINKII